MPPMIQRRSGRIVTVGSNGARLLDKPLTASYAAAKAGVIQFTRHVELELGPHSVLVDAIAPAIVLSDRVRRIMDGEAIERTGSSGRLRCRHSTGSARHRIGALATPPLVTESAAWLAGVTLDISGRR